jgi:RimJ/RimL family protein N-acetyltransferase
VLRDLESKDLSAVHDYSSDPEVVRYMDWGPNTDEDDKKFLERALGARKENPRRNFTLAVVLKDTNRLI